MTGCTNPFEKPSPAGLQVTTEGSVASVFLNGEYVNKTPYIDKELSPGRYTLRIEPEDTELAAHETSVLLTSSTLTVFNWSFGPTVETSGGVLYEMEAINQKNKAALSVTSIPDGTIIKLNGESKGFTPVLIDDIQAGSQRLQVTLPSYVEQERNLNVIEGYQMNVTVKLAKELSSLDRALENQADATASAELADQEATPSAGTVTPTKPPTRSQLTNPPTATSSGTLSKEPPYVTITETGTGWLRVRAEASATAEELTKVDVGESFPYISSNNGWHEIEYEPGETGWISGQFANVVRE